MNILKTLYMFLLIVILPSSLSCKKSDPEKAIPVVHAERHSDGAQDTHNEKPHEKEAEEKDLSDLDRPIAELFTEVCEHEKKAFECDECRYENGIVRVPASIFDGKLLNTEKVVHERIEIPLVLTGEVQFDERLIAHISTQAEGIIRKVYVALGDKVKKGQALVEIESVVVRDAESAYLEAQATLRFAQRNYERVAELKKEAISSEKEYLQSKQELEVAEIRAEFTLGKLTRLGMTMTDTKILSQTSSNGSLVLRAHTDGTILSLHAVSGETAKTDQSLVTIGDNTTVWVWADLYEQEIALVTQKQREHKLSALVTVKAYPDTEFPGIVDFISPLMEESSRTVKLRVEVKNATGNLLAGMFTNMKIFLPGQEEVTTVSQNAVLEDEGRFFVFIQHHGDYYVRRPVITGRFWNNRIEVIKGIQRGETIVTDGCFLLKSDVLRSKMGAGCAD